jgi:hypothetical protein
MHANKLQGKASAMAVTSTGSTPTGPFTKLEAQLGPRESGQGAKLGAASQLAVVRQIARQQVAGHGRRDSDSDDDERRRRRRR